MLVDAGYCAGRLAVAGVRRRETDLDADGLHLVMGVAMAGMLAPALSFLSPGTWEMVFGVTAAWFAWQAARVWRGYGPGSWRCAFPRPHLAESLAMVYAFAAGRPAAMGTHGGAGMSAIGAARFPVLAVVFALFMVGYVAWLGDRLTSISPGAAVAAKACWPVLAPRAAAWYKIAMGITMGYMLIIML
jgi:hypothetical protein